MMEHELRRRIVEEARNLIGTPYAHQHRSRHFVDCVGLVIRTGVAAVAMRWDEQGAAWQRVP